jgi:ribosomal protein L29
VRTLTAAELRDEIAITERDLLQLRQQLLALKKVYSPKPDSTAGRILAALRGGPLKNHEAAAFAEVPLDLANTTMFRMVRRGHIVRPSAGVVALPGVAN